MKEYYLDASKVRYIEERPGQMRSELVEVDGQIQPTDEQMKRLFKERPKKLVCTACKDHYLRSVSKSIETHEVDFHGDPLAKFKN